MGFNGILIYDLLGFDGMERDLMGFVAVFLSKSSSQWDNPRLSGMIL